MPYAWGSRGAIAALQGRPPSGQPEAELWIGAHPQAPSTLERDGRSLGALIEDCPQETVGQRLVDQFGGRLPFMVKVIAAAQALSLQVHPDDDDARAGFAREAAAGLDVTDPRRNYRDANAKPEMVLAISPFEALLGFRSSTEAAEALASLRVRSLDGVVAALRDGAATGDAFLQLVQWPLAERAQLIAAVRAAASSDQDLAWVVELADRHPDDPGVVAALLLNRRTLAPGQACYVAPGVIHAYLRGTAIEVLGCSDNVVRAGLTAKHIAVEELRSLLTRTATPPVLLEPHATSDGEERWQVPRPEFQLARLRVDGKSVAARRGEPELLLCVSGKVEVCGGDQSVGLRSGESCFVDASTPELTFVGQGVTVRATPGDLTPHVEPAA
jgi:mannose-6-phosphate isomerase